MRTTLFTLPTSNPTLSATLKTICSRSRRSTTTSTSSRFTSARRCVTRSVGSLATCSQSPTMSRTTTSRSTTKSRLREIKILRILRATGMLRRASPPSRVARASSRRTRKPLSSLDSNWPQRTKRISLIIKSRLYSYQVEYILESQMPRL